MVTASPTDSRARPSVQAIQGWKRAVLLPLGTLIRLWGASLRFQTSPLTEHWLRKTDQPVAFAVWHNRLFLVSEVFRRYRQGRPISALISASKDGAWLTAFFSLVGINSVRGSSSKLGREAVTALVDAVRAGNDIGITPDGPRGPCYEFKSGATIVARRTRAPILLLGGAFESAWQFKSWDRFYLPKPFSRVRLYCVMVSPDQLGDREETTRWLEEKLKTLSPDRPTTADEAQII